MAKENDFEFDFFQVFTKQTSELTIKKQKRELNDIQVTRDLWTDFTEVIDSNYSENSPAFILSVEATLNIDASIHLAINGYYRQAITLLRCWFENSLYSLYFQDHPVEFGKWYSGEFKPKQLFMLSFDELLRYIFQFDNYKKFNEIYKKKIKKEMLLSFKEWIEEIYSELSAHVHGRGYYRISLASVTFRKGEHRLYSKKYFLRWYDLFDDVFQIIVVSFLLYNPDLMNRFTTKRKVILDSLYGVFEEILLKDFGIKK